MHGSGRWDSITSRAYYSFGLLYYFDKFFLAGGIATAAASLPGFFRSGFPYELVGTPIASGLVGASVFLWTRVQASQLQSHNPGLYHNLIDITLIAQSNDSYEYTRVTTVKAIHNDVEYYRHKFQFSPGGAVTATAGTGVKSIILEPEQFGTNTVCRIQFHRPLRKGETVTFDYKLSYSGSMSPFLAQLVNYPIDKLILRVNVHALKRIGSCTRQIRLSSSSDIPAWEKEISFLVNQEQDEWVIYHPRIHYRYLINW